MPDVTHASFTCCTGTKVLTRSREQMTDVTRVSFAAAPPSVTSVRRGFCRRASTSRGACSRSCRRPSLGSKAILQACSDYLLY